MRASRRVTLALAVLWLASTACGEAFTTEGGGGGGAGGSTHTGSSTGSTAGSPTGSATGTESGSVTSSGTSVGSTSSTTPSGSPGPACPDDPCAPADVRENECDGCIADVCALGLGCCDSAWTLDCAAAYVRACGRGSCVDPCKALFGMVPNYELCSDEPGCSFMTSAPHSCNEICNSRGTACVYASQQTSCDTAEIEMGCEAVNLDSRMRCECAPGCPDVLCPPDQVCSGTNCWSAAG